jgi:hypothetical protein
LQYNVCDPVAGNSWAAPRLVPSLSYRGIVQLALPGPQCGLLSTGQVLCWGSDIPQVLGTGGSDVADSVNVTPDGDPACSSPVMVPVDGVTKISTGMDHTCVTRTDGTVWCWGFDLTLQAYPDVQWTLDFTAAHDGSPPAYVGSPRPIPTLTGAIDIASGTGTCARFADGTLQCWGGETPPNAPTGFDYNPPIKPIALDHVVQVTVGDYTAFALRDDGTVFEFTFGPGPFPSAPFEVEDLRGATRLFATPWDGTLGYEGVLRGEYVAAQFPDGSMRVHSVDVITVLHDDAGLPIALADGGYQAEQNKDPTVLRSALPLGVVEGAQGATLVAAADLVLCVVIGDDEVRCEGDNSFGQLGRTTVGGWQEPLGPVLWPFEVASSH